MNKNVLTRPFPASALKQRQGANGRVFSYVQTHEVVRRLNEGCDAWDFEILKHEVLAEEVVVLGRLTIEGTIKKAAFGGSSITRDRAGRETSVADDLKAAASDALKKAASLLGVGLELYGASAPTDSVVPNASTSEADRLTPRQHAAVQALVRRNDVGDEQLVRLLEARFRKSELGLLSRGEASSLLSELGGAQRARAH